MKRFLIHLLILGALGLAGAATVIGLGLYNVSARSGHLPGVSWILHTAYRNSVRRNAPPEEAVPQDLDDPGLVALGAGHYQQACSFCHGSPAEPRSATVLSMEPPPPSIAQAVRKWQANHLFWIVRNGVKMTGMPAWPNEERKDDVWAVVAFLRQVDGMDAGTYRRLIAPPGAAAALDAGPPGLAACAACHGNDGSGGGNPHVPRLDINGAAYLAGSLSAYRAGIRSSGIMQHAASALTDAEIDALARHYASAAAPVPAQGDTADPDAIERGRVLASAGSNASGVPACRACHGPWPSQRSDRFPNLAGQSRRYLLDQLDLFKAGHRGGTELVIMMHKVVRELDEPEMAALAAYYAALPPARSPAADRPSTR